MEARSGEPTPLFFGTFSIGPLRPPQPPRRAWAAGQGYEVELRGPAEAAGEIDAWRALARRALEPGPFADPDLLLPALQHLADGRQASLLLAWQATPAGRMLRGLFPVVMPRLPFVPGEVRLWRPDALPLAPALVDREQPEAVLAAVLSFCGSRGPRCASLALPAVLADGLLRAALERALGGRSLAAPPTGSALHAAAVPDQPEPARRFLPDGESRLVNARSPAQVRDAVETFLLLDAAGAKARHEAALIQDAGAASFLRTATRQLARHGHCRVEVLGAAGAPAAASIVIESADAFWVWRTAAAAGEGGVDMLVASAAARARRRGKRLIVPSSVRVSSHALAALRFVPLPLADLLIPTRPGRSPSAAVSRIRSRIERHLRKAASGGVPRPLRA